MSIYTLYVCVYIYIYMYIYYVCVYIYMCLYIYIYIYMNSIRKENAFWESVARRENISPIILARTKMTWACTRLQRVIASENLAACESYESTT